VYKKKKKKKRFKKINIQKFINLIFIAIVINFYTVISAEEAINEIKEPQTMKEAMGTYLTDKDYQIIKQNYKYYHWAATNCSIPIEALIAIHHRESRLRRGWYSYKRKVVVKNLGGPFMLDCGGENTGEFEANIRREERRIAKKYNFKGDTRVSYNFAFACLVAVDYIKTKARYGLDTRHGIADMFWGYNGRAHKSYLHSAYVYSDPKNGKTMSFTYLGKTKVDFNPGCLALWRELKKSKKLRIIASKYQKGLHYIKSYKSLL